MKEELEKLGFEDFGDNLSRLIREESFEYIAVYKNNKEVWIGNRRNEVFLFKYNHEKLKQLTFLILLLS